MLFYLLYNSDKAPLNFLLSSFTQFSGFKLVDPEEFNRRAFRGELRR